jgi:hypothetical protein
MLQKRGKEHVLKFPLFFALPASFAVNGYRLNLPRLAYGISVSELPIDG